MRLNSSSTPAPQSLSLVVAQTPLRLQIAAAQGRVKDLGGDIDALDAALQDLQHTLGQFEVRYHERLHRVLRRLALADLTLRRLARWETLIEATVAERTLAKEARRLYVQHRGEAPRRAASAAKAATASVAAPAAPAAPLPLKALWRRLARRYHPDLATTEADKAHLSQTMAHINALYHAGDVTRLAMFDAGMDSADAQDDEAATLQRLEHRVRHLAAVADALRRDLATLQASPTHAMWQQTQQEDEDSFFDPMEHTMDARAVALHADVPAAARYLEVAVTRTNSKNDALTTAPKKHLQGFADPSLPQYMMRLGLESAERARITRPTQAAVDRITRWADDNPDLLRLALLAHVSNLTPAPLEGLNHMASLQSRWLALCTAAGDNDAVPIESALSDAAGEVEYAVVVSPRKTSHTALRLLDTNVARAMPLALGQLPVKRMFRHVLGVLGEQGHCDGCATHVFFLPVLRSTGLDDLRASVCPKCGVPKRKYWLPLGQDIQSVLNHAYLEYDLIYEFAFDIYATRVRMQVAACELPVLRVKDLKARLIEDVFTRYNMPVRTQDLHLTQNNKSVSDTRAVNALGERYFSVDFQAEGHGGAQALKEVQRRIRTKFCDPMAADS